MKIGLISDTHGPIPEDVMPYIRECDELWHAGDLGDLYLFEQVPTDMTFRAVWGNIDGANIRVRTKEYLFFNIAGITVLMIHIGGYPGRYSSKARTLIEMHKPDLFISGHSHILKIMRDSKAQLIHMNPGACGHKGFHSIRTMIRFSIEGKIKDVEVIELGKRGVANQ